MGVQAKFFVDEKTEFKQQGGGWEGWRVKLSAARGLDNEKWATASPSGSLEMVIANPKAAAEFVPGGYVMIDITSGDQPDELGAKPAPVPPID